MLKKFLQFVFFCCVFGFFQNCHADEGIDIFLKAVDHQQNNGSVLSGRGSYSLITTSGGKSKDEINDEIDELTADLDRLFPDTPNEENRYEASRSIKSKYSQERHIDGSFQFDYSKDENGYSKTTLIFDNNPSNQTINIEKRKSENAAKKSEGALYEAAASIVFVNNTASTAGDFSRFGRLQGLAPSLMAFIISQNGFAAAKDAIKAQAEAVSKVGSDTKILEIVETKPFAEGAEALTIESSIDGKVTQRYTIVPAFGYICPLEQLYDQNTGNLTNEYLASDFFLNERSGLYYPATYIESAFDPVTGALITKKEYKIEQESLSLNEPMSPADFALDVPEGIWVQDVREGKKELFRASSDGVLSLAPGGLDLSKMNWLDKDSGESSRNRTSAAGNKRISHLRIFFMLIGICFILIGLGLAFKKRSGVLLFFLLLSINFTCLPVRAELRNEPKIIVNPSVLDFGHVRPVDSPVRLNFEIINKGNRNVVISDIVSGCGCTVVQIPDTPIKPGTTARASLKINLLGRMGDFNNSVRIKTQDGETVSLDIHGVIETDIWYNGQTIRTTASKDQRTVSTSLVIYTTKYPDVEFDETSFNDIVSAKVVSRENNQDEETKIVLSVDVNIGENDMISSNLELVPTDKSISPLVIPVYCERSYEEQSVPQLITNQVGLGVLERGGQKVFSVYGDPDILQVVRSVELKNASSDFLFEILKDVKDPQIDELKISAEVDQAQPGRVEGTLVLKTVGNREYPIPFFCEVKD